MGKKKRGIRRVVLDTNIFVSALLFDGQASAFVGLWKEAEIIPLICAETMKEIIRVLAYPKFALSDEEIKSIINEDILPYIETVRVSRKIEGVCSDPADDIFLTCGVNGKAQAIVSGDADLLGLKVFEGIPVMTVSEFMDRRQKSRTRDGEYTNPSVG